MMEYSLENIGHKMTDWYFRDYEYVRDLIEFEGPYLVLYTHKDKSDEHAFYYWVDTDQDKFNRWICYKVKQPHLDLYLNGSMSLYEVMRDNVIYFMVDIDHDLNYHNYKMLEFSDMPEKYFPDKNSYYVYKND